METKKIQDYSNIAVTNLDPEKAKIVNERGIELQRLKKQVDVAIKKAEELGRTDMVKKLEARRQQLDTLLRGKTFKDLSDGGQIGGDISNTTSENSSSESSNQNQTDTDRAENETSKKEQEQGLETETKSSGNDAGSDNEETSADNNTPEESDSSFDDEEEKNDEAEPENDTVTGNSEESANSTDDEAATTDKANIEADDTEAEEQSDSKNTSDGSSDKEANTTDDDIEKDIDNGTNDDSNTDSEATNDKQADQQQNSDQADRGTTTDRNNVGQKNGNTSDNDDGSGQADEDDPVKDIFNRPENTKQQLGGQSQMQKKESRDPTIDEIIHELQSISQNGRQGAARALKDILSNRGVTDFSESLDKKVLKEAIEDKALEDIDDEEFSDFVNTILDEINNVTPVAYSDPDERKVKVKQAMENNLETRDIEMEQEMQVRADKRRIRANQSELDKYTNYRPISEFYMDLYRTIADQVKQVEIDNQSYDEINPEYDDDVIMKADVTQYEQRQEKPSIDFFFDVSGS